MVILHSPIGVVPLYHLTMAKTEYNWSRDLRFITDRVNRIPDPIDRLEFLDLVREALRTVLTENYEKAAFDARRLDRDEEAVAFLSKVALREYSRRYNGRFGSAERVRWADPLNVERRQQVEDLTEVAKGNHPESVATGFREVKLDPPQEP